MNWTKLFVVVAASLAAAACSYTETRTAAPYRMPGSEQACLDYGFRAGTEAYNRCVIRESEARAQGRVTQDYTTVRLDADARNACYSYGLTPGTAMYDRCVGREIDARRYREQAAPYYPAPASAAVYPAPAYPAAPYVETRPTPPAGVQVFRDEYGFRYDGQGNRIDRNGNIISPQSTSP